ncbi:GNAT family N-acetyltransferase [Vibrio palustris]|uniref:N-acetyltransferase domain-containing protein n=1 Tax=Vibrio palustris TaxID=1918946 RepID=A0A1R4B164_9VIBR|nr:GNAT family protein [Vibrio palustris]SJL82660.1 hypothetical protein VPAL9027_00592 [Vibrio palustris]
MIRTTQPWCVFDWLWCHRIEEQGLSVTIVTRRMLLVPYIEALESEFLLLNCCTQNRAFMNGPLTVSLARNAFQRFLYQPDAQAMAVLNNVTREYMGHMSLDMIGEHVASLTCIFDKLSWGKGYASEAINAFLPHICQQKQINTVMMNIPVDHHVGLHLVKKLGFTQKAHIMDDFLGDYYQFEWHSEINPMAVNDVVAHRAVANESHS